MRAVLGAAALKQALADNLDNALGGIVVPVTGDDGHHPVAPSLLPRPEQAFLGLGFPSEGFLNLSKSEAKVSCFV